MTSGIACHNILNCITRSGIAHHNVPGFIQTILEGVFGLTLSILVPKENGLLVKQSCCYMKYFDLNLICLLSLKYIHRNHRNNCSCLSSPFSKFQKSFASTFSARISQFFVSFSALMHIQSKQFQVLKLLFNSS